MDIKTWLIVGASRGIGLEFVRQILASGHRVVATSRGSGNALDAIAKDAPDRVTLLTCDVSMSQSITVGILSRGLRPANNADMLISSLELHRPIHPVWREEDSLCGDQCWHSGISECNIVPPAELYN